MLCCRVRSVIYVSWLGDGLRHVCTKLRQNESCDCLRRIGNASNIRDGVLGIVG